MNVNEMIKGEWAIHQGSAQLHGVKVKDVPTSEENLNALLKKLAAAHDMPPQMRLGLKYKCAHMIEELDKNKEFFVDEKSNLREEWKKFRKKA